MRPITPKSRLKVIERAAILEADFFFPAPRYCEISTALAPDITVNTSVAIEIA